MECPRYIVFDDAPESRKIPLTADQIAEALRIPLAVIGVRVVRKQGARSSSSSAGFQGRGSTRRQFQVTLQKVEGIVNEVVARSMGPVETMAIEYEK
jgi:hypothetical protein